MTVNHWVLVRERQGEMMKLIIIKANIDILFMFYLLSSTYGYQLKFKTLILLSVMHQYWR